MQTHQRKIRQAYNASEAIPAIDRLARQAAMSCLLEASRKLSLLKSHHRGNERAYYQAQGWLDQVIDRLQEGEL